MRNGLDLLRQAACDSSVKYQLSQKYGQPFSRSKHVASPALYVEETIDLRLQRAAWRPGRQNARRC